MTTSLDVGLSGPSREGKIGYFATALVNLGEAAVLGVHRIAQRPVVRDVPFDDRLPDQVEVAAYYTVSEALTNASKPSDAKRVWVSLDLVLDSR